MNVAVPLISAAVAALVAWIVALRQGRSARESWVLNKRYAVYERIFAAGHALLGAESWEDTAAAVGDAAKRDAFFSALLGLELIAPRAISNFSNGVGLKVVAVRDSPEGDARRVDLTTELVATTDELFSLLRDDLVPKHMR